MDESIMVKYDEMGRAGKYTLARMTHHKLHFIPLLKKAKELELEKVITKNEIDFSKVTELQLTFDNQEYLAKSYATIYREIINKAFKDVIPSRKELYVRRNYSNISIYLKLPYVTWLLRNSAPHRTVQQQLNYPELPTNFNTLSRTISRNLAGAGVTNVYRTTTTQTGTTITIYTPFSQGVPYGYEACHTAPITILNTLLQVLPEVKQVYEAFEQQYAVWYATRKEAAEKYPKEQIRWDNGQNFWFIPTALIEKYGPVPILTNGMSWAL